MVHCIQVQNFTTMAESVWIGVSGTKVFQVGSI